MKIEIKNWLGVVILLSLGFVIGRITVLPEVNANPQESKVGRYQLIAGEYEVMVREFNKESGEDSLPTTGTNSQKTLFRIDTVTGEVDMYIGCETTITPETMTFTYMWDRITGKAIVKN